MSQAQAAYHAADLKYSMLKPKHDLLCSEFLASQLIDQSLLDKHHKAIAWLASLNSLRDTYHQMQAIQNLSTGRSLPAVEYTTLAGTKISTSCPAVESMLSSSLQTCFTWAHGFPFWSLPLCLWLVILPQVQLHRKSSTAPLFAHLILTTTQDS